MTREIFEKMIEESYRKYFKKSMIKFQVYKCIGETDLMIYPYLATKKEDLSYGYYENDMMHISISVSLKKEDAEIGENVLVEFLHKSYATKPEERWMAFGRRKVTARKFVSTPEKAVVNIDKFFSRLHQEVKKDLENNNIHESYLQLVKDNLI